MAPNNILVIGAGELGMAVISNLTSHPARRQTPISVLFRQASIDSQDASKRSLVADLRSLGISLTGGDVVRDSIETLASVFRAFHTVIVCTGFGLPPGTQLKIAQAALDAEVSRYFPWQFGVDYDVIGLGSEQDLFDEQLGVRALLRGQQLGTDWTIISTGMFVSFLFEPGFGIVDMKEGTARALGDWTTEVTVTAVDDIGKMTAEIVFLPDETTRGVVFVAGDTISYGRLADVVEKETGRELSRECWSQEHLRAELAKNPENKMNKYRGVFAAGVGVAWPIEKTLNHRRGLQLNTVDDYVRAKYSS